MAAGQAKRRRGSRAPQCEGCRKAGAGVGKGDIGQHAAIPGVRRPVPTKPIAAALAVLMSMPPPVSLLAQLVDPLTEGRRRCLGPLVEVGATCPGISSTILGILPSPIGLSRDSLVQHPAQGGASRARRRAAQAPGMRARRLHGEEPAHALAEILRSRGSGDSLVRRD